jgi:hypothetical protein
MAIEQLGESLLAQAKKKSKKEERKAKQFMGLLLGIQAGNAILRNKAKQRAETFLTGNAGLINQRTKQFNKGIEFWDGHTKMMSKYGAAGVDDWENAKRQELYDLYKARELGGKDPKDLEQFKVSVDAKIQDELKAYGEKLELFQNFRNIKDTAEERKTFLKPIQDKLDKGVEIINQESNVGGWMLGQLGPFGRGKAKLEEVVIDQQRLLLPFSYGEKRKEELVKILSKDQTFAKELSDINNSVVYTPLSPEELKTQLGPKVYNSEPDRGHSQVLRNAISGNEDDRNKTMLYNRKYTIGSKNLTIYQLYQREMDRDPTGNSAELLASQILGFAKQAKQNWELSGQDRPFEDNIKNDDYFVDQGIRTYIEKNYLNNNKPQNPTSEELNFNANTVINFSPAGVDKVFNKTLGAYQNDFQNILNLRSKEDAEEYINDFKNSTEEFEGKDKFIVTLQNLYNNKYVPKEPSPFARQGSFFQANRNFKTNPLSIPGRN